MSAKHTDWHYTKRSGFNNSEMRVFEIEPIGFSASTNLDGEQDMESAAKLLSAAPKLLEACKRLLAIVRLQNGNLHADTNQLQAEAIEAINLAESAEGAAK